MKDKGNKKDEQKRFLEAVQNMLSEKKSVVRKFQGKTAGEQRQQPRQPVQQQSEEPDKLTQLILKQRDENAKRQAEEALISQNMLYSRAAGAHPAPSVIPAAQLGFTQQDPERGVPIGVDLNTLSPEQRQAVFSRLPLEEQEALVARLNANQGGNI